MIFRIDDVLVIVAGVVLPLTSLTYVWTMLLSDRVLKERITGRKIAGVMLILAGAALVSI